MAKVCTLRREIFQECTLFLRVLQESSHIFSEVCTEYFGPASRCALLFIWSAQVFKFWLADTFCIKCAQFSEALQF